MPKNSSGVARQRLAKEIRDTRRGRWGCAHGADSQGRRNDVECAPRAMTNGSFPSSRANRSNLPGLPVRSPGRFPPRNDLLAYECARAFGARPSFIEVRSRRFAASPLRAAKWRRVRDSNPGYGFPHTRFPSVLLKPLGQLSAAEGKYIAAKIPAALRTRPARVSQHPATYSPATIFGDAGGRKSGSFKYRNMTAIESWSRFDVLS